MTRARVAFALVVSLSVIHLQGQTPPAAGPPTVTGGGGVKLAVYEAGNPDGPAILFVHGFTASHLSWGPQFAGPLSKDFRLVAFDLRGHGASDKPLEATQYTDSKLWAQDVDAVIRAKKLTRPVIVGWSYGGYVIADYVRAHGDANLGGLVFVGAVTKSGSEDAQKMIAEPMGPIFANMLSPEVLAQIQGTQALLRAATVKPLERDAFEIMLGNSMLTPQPVRVAMSMRTLDNDDVLGKISVPTLVIHGRQDAIVHVASSEHIAKTVPGATLQIWDTVGHAPPLEDSERFNRELAEFVRSARKGGTS